MNVSADKGPGWFRINYGRDADWAILVVDDKESIVWLMAEVLDTNQLCNHDSVIEFWNSISGSNESFERTLVLLPWMLADECSCASITFANFPNSDQEAMDFLAAAGELKGRRVAVLIDIHDAQGAAPRQRFVETWERLQRLAHPAPYRARFTRGGADLPLWTEQVPIFRKEPPQGGPNAQRLDLLKVFEKVRTQLSAHEFQDATSDEHTPVNEKSCHDPSDILSASRGRRMEVCVKLCGSDQFGVWKWAAELADKDFADLVAARRWLCAKAVHRSSPMGKEAPITAIIAICEGVRHVENRITDYAVSSGLNTVDQESVDRLPCLGIAQFALGTYGEFASALRDWLINSEQFKDGNASIKGVRIFASKDAKILRLELRYTGELPGGIFSCQAGMIAGRTARCWQSLAQFPRFWNHDRDIVTLEFNMYL